MSGNRKVNNCQRAQAAGPSETADSATVEDNLTVKGI